MKDRLSSAANQSQHSEERFKLQDDPVEKTESTTNCPEPTYSGHSSGQHDAIMPRRHPNLYKFSQHSQSQLIPAMHLKSPLSQTKITAPAPHNSIHITSAITGYSSAPPLFSEKLRLFCASSRTSSSPPLHHLTEPSSILH
ncbi:hypothetical protein M0R45_034437 [Rubus argutus]|uniref:Uncharacterized protein n=1 Tax=Rubus argutus TaxID=59490 RepID=A0AAW1VUA8_RUBAR